MARSGGSLLKHLPLRVLSFFTVLLLASSPFAMRAGAAGGSAVAEIAVDPSLNVRIGTAAASDRLVRVAGLFRVADGTSLLAALNEVNDGSGVRYRAEGIAFDIVTLEHAPLRVEQATVSLVPATDGRSVRFEASGVTFGGASSIEGRGVVEWSAGPLGGDRLEAEFLLRDAPVEALRALAPERFDPSIVGSLDLAVSASGIVGETSSEDVPATPLNGKVTANVDWSLLGRTAPLVVRTDFSIDDRSVRLKGGRMEWSGLGLDVSGWFDPRPTGKFSVVGKFQDVDAAAVATDWAVPEPWRPQASVSGRVEFAGSPGESLLRYDATAPSIVVPALGGYTVRLGEPKIHGNLAAINTEVSASIRSKSVRVGDLDLGDLPLGLTWWRKKLLVSAANSRLWGGSNDTTLVYEPSQHPAFGIVGRVSSAVAGDLAAGIAPTLGLDVEGSGSFAFRIQQDRDFKRTFQSTLSLRAGRFSTAALFAETLAALTSAQPSLSSAAAEALVAATRQDKGTRVDGLFLEAVSRDSTWPLATALDLGGVFLRRGDFQFDGDGELSSSKACNVEGTVTFPADVADALAVGAPWLSTLRGPGGTLVVPVTLSGSVAAPKVALAASYTELLSQARAGAAVTAPEPRRVRHLDVGALAPIPGDPSRDEME